jgi:hypothetical protein
MATTEGGRQEGSVVAAISSWGSADIKTSYSYTVLPCIIIIIIIIIISQTIAKKAPNKLRSS